MRHRKYQREEHLAVSSIGYFILLVIAAGVLVLAAVSSAWADCSDIYASAPGRHCSIDDIQHDTLQRKNETMWRNYEQDQRDEEARFQNELDREEMQREFDAKLRALEDEMRKEQ